MHLLTLNCGSSSIKGKLYHLPSPSAPLEPAAKISVSNIGSKGDKVKLKVNWLDHCAEGAGGAEGAEGRGKGQGKGERKDVDDELGDGGEMERKSATS